MDGHHLPLTPQEMAMLIPTRTEYTEMRDTEAVEIIPHIDYKAMKVNAHARMMQGEITRLSNLAEQFARASSLPDVASLADMGDIISDGLDRE